jgi:Mg2+ and Co2+ transporter CorA
MTAIYISILVLLFLMIGPAYYARMTKGYTDMIRKLEYEVQKLDDELESMLAERDVLQEREDELKAEQIAIVQAQHGLTSFSESAVEYDSAIGYLMQAGKLRQEDLQKAQDFKEGSQSPYDLEEVLIMLDIVSSYDMESAKKKVAGK